MAREDGPGSGGAAGEIILEDPDSDPSVSRMLSENARGILYMIATCALITINDTAAKLASEEVPISQIIVIRGFMALFLAWIVCWRLRLLPSLALLRERYLWLRTLGEMGATAAFLSALARLEIASVTAIIQTAPLAVTAGAALFLKERVPWGRWAAIALGFLAVLLIIQPGTAGFTIWSLVALVAVFFIALRDLASRMMPRAIHPYTVVMITMACTIVLGFMMAPLNIWMPVSARVFLLCLLSAVALSGAFAFLVRAMHTGDVAIVTPFRYTALLWAILVQIIVFDTVPNLPTLVGSALLVLTGLCILWPSARRTAEQTNQAARAGVRTH